MEIKNRHEANVPTVYKFKFQTLRKQCQDFQHLFNNQLAEQKMIDSLPKTPPVGPQVFQETEQMAQSNIFSCCLDEQRKFHTHADHMIKCFFF